MSGTQQANGAEPQMCSRCGLEPRHVRPSSGIVDSWGDRCRALAKERWSKSERGRAWNAEDSRRRRASPETGDEMRRHGRESMRRFRARRRLEAAGPGLATAAPGRPGRPRTAGTDKLPPTKSGGPTEGQTDERTIEVKEVTDA